MGAKGSSMAGSREEAHGWELDGGRCTSRKPWVGEARRSMVHREEARGPGGGWQCTGRNLEISQWWESGGQRQARSHGGKLDGRWNTGRKPKEISVRRISVVGRKVVG